ncbi:uncharacterized protein LOC121367917 [Gigantopelta aegis]|uniref:uncharacterized protein LOC121367917 n=1 Tax=Gigantopelta aegis TaxID=1735272 RepID=UPI001B88CA9A|nr:uncharacterized protein LOC121367917 [Gigantopelta aegis]
MAPVYVLIAVVISVVCDRILGEDMVCDSGMIAQNGDIDFVYILELHEAQNGTCGLISSTEIQNAIAIDWAINKLNGNGNPNRSFIPGVQIGYKIYDDCGLKKHAIQSLFDVWDARGSCNTSLQTPIAGIIGTTVSQSTTAVADMLSTSRIPMIGVSATTPDLSNKTLYPNYIRTVPSDAIQSKVILDIVKHLNWSYIVGVHTDDNYGTNGFEHFRQYAENSGICVFRTHVIHREDTKLQSTLTDFIRSLFIDLEKTRDGNVGGVYYGFNKEAVLLYRTITERQPSWVLERESIHKVHWVMSDGVGNSAELARELQPYKNMVITVSPSVVKSSEIRDNFASVLSTASSPSMQDKWSPWINEYVEYLYHCSPPASSDKKLTACSASLDMMRKFSFYDYVTAALDATYILADVMKSAHGNMCSSRHEYCAPFLKKVKDGILPEYRPGPIRYSDFEQEVVPELFVRNGRELVVTDDGDLTALNSSLYDFNLASDGQFYTIGHYIDDSLELNESLMMQLRHSRATPSSACKHVCRECHRTPEVPFAYIPGDVLLLGLFSLHTPHSSRDYRCSDGYSQRGLHALLSFLGAVEALKEETGERFGAIAIDDCYNPLTSSLILNTVLSGKTILKDPVTQEVIDVSKIVAAVGAQSSTVTLAAVQPLQNLGIPLVSYGATSPVLDDKETYPFFLRTVPSDTVQSKAMVELVQKLGVTHVSTISINNNYGRKGIGQFRMMAEKLGICVGDPYEVSVDSNVVTLFSILTLIAESGSKVIVYFGTASIASDLLDSMEDFEEPMIFIGSEAWGANPDVLRDRRSLVVRGSFTFVVDVNVKISNLLRRHILSLSPKNITHNPWLGHFWQANFQCNLPGGFDNIFSKLCPLSVRLSNEDVNTILAEDLALRVIEAVHGVGYGFMDAKRLAACSSTWPCRSFTSGLLLDRIKNVSLRDESGTISKPFTKAGNGNVGFIINNIQRLPSGSYGYVPVGSFSEQNGLQIKREDITFYDAVGRPGYELKSSCEFITLCRVCLDRHSKGDNSTSVRTDGSVSEELLPVVIVLSVLCFLMMVFLVIIVVVLIRNKTRRSKEFSNRLGHQPRHHSYEDLDMQEVPRNPNVPTLSNRLSPPVPCSGWSQGSTTPNTTDSSTTSTFTTHSSLSHTQVKPGWPDNHGKSITANSQESSSPTADSVPSDISTQIQGAMGGSISPQKLNPVPENDISNAGYIHPVFDPEQLQGFLNANIQMPPRPSFSSSSSEQVTGSVPHMNKSFSDVAMQTMPHSQSASARQRSYSDTIDVGGHLDNPGVTSQKGQNTVEEDNFRQSDDDGRSVEFV